MKRALLVMVAVASLFLTGCGIHFPLTTNMNNNLTNVELSENNFTVVKTVSGEAEAQYVLGIGGLKKRALAELAKKDMVAEADMEGKSRAIINVTTEEYVKNFVFVVRRRVVVTGQVVEFK